MKVEAEGFARCKKTVDMDIGIKNFMQNGPRVPAMFLHELTRSRERIAAPLLFPPSLPPFLFAPRPIELLVRTPS